MVAIGELIGQFFLNSTGLYALLALIPFLLLYLMRPTPKKRILPALMFFIKEQGMTNKNSFLQTLIRNVLFFFHLLLILILAFAIAQPFINLSKEALTTRTVLILDSTASMQADFEGGSRFKAVKEEALKRVGVRTTIIVSSDIPELMGDEVEATEAEELLLSLRPRDTEGSLNDALIMASDFVRGNAKVVVLSDFIDPTVDSFEGARDLLTASGAIVEFVSYNGFVENVGIVDLVVEDSGSKAWIKNYADIEKSVTLLIGDKEESITIQGKSTELFSFTTPPGKSVLSIKENDGFLIDNKAYISSFEGEVFNVGVITNDPPLYINTALSLIPRVNLTYYTPPKVPRKFDEDILVLAGVDPELVLPGTLKDLELFVKEGKRLIIAAQPSLFEMDIESLIGTSYISLNEEASSVTSVVDSELTQDIIFGTVFGHFVLEDADDLVELAWTESGPLIFERNLEGGKVFWYGIMDEDSDFKTNLYYPIFWKRIIEHLVAYQTTDELNVKTGVSYVFPERVEVQSPSGALIGQQIPLEEMGFYEFPERAIAANLLSSEESDVGRAVSLSSERSEKGDSIMQKVPKEVTDKFLLLALIVFIVELIYLKIRGDL
ncbi:hypothetical protein CMO92_02385 [Candidatus Woesearchaeota archaeon]|nr:hypothetical protein [Candidatus Woesearchaeota archaeon]|tara:strand:- start:70 stop:1890 length:1821 start_codon:yes stop_codon:yes gene_type:complete